MQTLSVYLPGIIVAFREWLEAFLIVIVLLRFLEKTGNIWLKKNIWAGVLLGVIISIAAGGILFWLGHFLGSVDGMGKIWESVMSLVAVGFIISFVLWMIHNSTNIKKHIENEASAHLSAWWILLMTAVFIAREGAEIAIFAYAGEYPWQWIAAGLISALLVALCLYIFSIRAKLTTLLTVTLLYLILQSGYLLGYSIHEWLSAMKELSFLNAKSFLFTQVFDVSHTVLNHKEGVIWVPLNIIFWWYSKPEWIQFIAQYLCTGMLFWVWIRSKYHQHR